MLPQVVRGSSGVRPRFRHETQNAIARSPSRHDVLEQSRRKRSCSDYAKSEPDWSVDNRGGTRGYNKKTWIKSAPFGSNRSQAQNIHSHATEDSGPVAEAQGVAAATRRCFARRKGRFVSIRGRAEWPYETVVCRQLPLSGSTLPESCRKLCCTSDGLPVALPYDFHSLFKIGCGNLPRTYADRRRSSGIHAKCNFLLRFEFPAASSLGRRRC